MLNPQNVEHGSPADSHDADTELPPAMPELAQLEVLPGPPQTPSTTTHQEPAQPPNTETANYSTVGYGQSTTPASTHYKNATMHTLFTGPETDNK